MPGGKCRPLCPVKEIRKKIPIKTTAKSSRDRADGIVVDTILIESSRMTVEWERDPTHSIVCSGFYLASFVVPFPISQGRPKV